MLARLVAASTLEAEGSGFPEMKAQLVTGTWGPRGWVHPPGCIPQGYGSSGPFLTYVKLGGVNMGEPAVSRGYAGVWHSHLVTRLCQYWLRMSYMILCYTAGEQSQQGEYHDQQQLVYNATPGFMIND